MTVPANIRKAGPYIGNDAATVFPFGFKVFTAEDLLVVKTDDLLFETVLQNGVDYTVALNTNQEEDPGGAVILNAALPDQFKLTIGSDMPITQPVQLTNQGGFYPEVINRALDRITIIAQQLLEQLGRTLKLPISANVDATLPTPTPNSILGWNSQGNGFVNIDPSGLATVGVYGNTRLEIFTGDGVQTDFILADDPVMLAAVDVSVGGVTQAGGLDFDLILGAVRFSSAPPEEAVIVVRYATGGLAPGLDDVARADGGNTQAGSFRAAINASGPLELGAADGSGGDLLKSKAVNGPSILRSYRDRLGDEISLWDVDGIWQHKDDIISGAYTGDLRSYIEAALAAYRRVIVRNGTYPISAAVRLQMSGQNLEFEDYAWFKAMSAGTVPSPVMGIACPHGVLDAKLINPGLIGCATTEVRHTAILWNSNTAGNAPHGSLTSDDMGGLVEYGRFKGANPATNGWNNFIHSNMAGGFVARHCVGKGLIGTASDNGYGHVASGADVRNEFCDFDGLITGNGRHAVYFGDQCTGGIITGLRARRFRKSAISVNTSVTDGVRAVQITDFILRDVALDADSSATNGAIELGFQGGATSGGAGVRIANGIVDGVGSMGFYASGYKRLELENVQINDWGKTAGGSYSAVKLLKCDDALVQGVQSFSSAANNGSNVIQHFFVQESSRVHLKGGKAVNTGVGAQGSAVSLNATGAGTPDCLIDRVQAVSGSGSWSISAFSNPNQNGSTFVPYKFGSGKVDTQTGDDVVLDVSQGESSVTVASGATSVLDLLSSGPGQRVDVILSGNTTVKANNLYLNGSTNFVGTANDVVPLLRTPGNLWVQVAPSSVN